MENQWRTFSSFLRHARKARSLTQYDLARELGVSQTYVYEFEKGRRGAPPLVHVLRLAEILRLDKEESRRFLELARAERTDARVFDVVLRKEHEIAALREELRSAISPEEILDIQVGGHTFRLPRGTQVPEIISRHISDHPDQRLTSGQLLVLLSFRGRGGELTPEGVAAAIREIHEEEEAHSSLDQLLSSNERQTVLKTIRALVMLTRKSV